MGAPTAHGATAQGRHDGARNEQVRSEHREDVPVDTLATCERAEHSRLAVPGTGHIEEYAANGFAAIARELAERMAAG